MKNNQKGFSAVEIVIVLVVLGLLGTAVWFVASRQKDTASSGTSQSPASSTQPSAADSNGTVTYKPSADFNAAERAELESKLIVPFKASTKNIKTITIEKQPPETDPAKQYADYKYKVYVTYSTDDSRYTSFLFAKRGEDTPMWVPEEPIAN